MGEVVKLDEIEVCASPDLDNNSTECPSKEESIGGPGFGDWATGVENGAGFLKDGRGLAEFFEILGKKASKIPDILDIVKAFDSNDTGYELTKTASKIWVGGKAAIWGSVRAIQLAMNSPFPKHPFFLGAAALLGGAAGAFGGSEAVDKLFDHLKSWGDSLGDRERSYSEYQKEFQKCLIDFDDKMKDNPIKPLPDDPFGREAFFEMMKAFDENYVIPCYNKCKTSSLDISFPTAYETDGTIVFEIKLSTPLDDNLELHIKTMDGSAKAGEDYEEKTKDIITIPAGETSYKYSIKLGIDNKYEGEELFALFAEIKNDAIIKKYNLEPTTVSVGTILDFPQEECPTTPKPKINPISLDLPPSPVYPTTRNEAPTYGSNTPGGSWSGGGSWGPGDWTYHPSVPHKPSLPNVPYIECYNEPYLNSMMIVKLGGTSRSLSALNYMSKDNSYNLSSPLIKDSLNSSSLNLNPSNSSLNHTDTSNPTTSDINTPNSTNSNKIYFDMNSDGFKERMLEWMNEDEAILVNDINKNGTIDNGTEILGNNYISNLTGSKSPDSYLLLKEFDTNKDGVIDIKDNSGLALWQDKNKNGITDKGELTYIGNDNSPIKSISVNPLDALLSAYDRNHDFKIDSKDTIYNYIYYKDNPDNTIDLYIYGDESAKSFLDFDTTNHTILTNQGIKKVNEIHFYEGELNLNNIANGDSLNNKLVGNSYANILNGNAGDDILEGLDGNDTLDGGSGSDKLYGGQGNDTLIGGKGNDLLDGGSWDDRYLFSKGDAIDVITDSHGNDTIEFDESIKLEDLIVKSNGKDLNISIKSNNTNHLSNQIIIKNYYGSGRIERVKFSDGKVLEVTDIISMMGTNKDDTIYLTNASQTIDAKDGKDTIYAGSGNNTIIGGKGNDKIFSSYGNDTYIYTKGDGSDIIQDSGGKDTLIVKGINSNEVKFLRSSNSLVLKFDDSNSITIANYFIDSNRIESFKFDDKDMVPNDIINSFITDGNDNIVGTDEGDILDAKGGDDSVVGLRGNDTLIGGDGDDKLYGNDGDDTLIGSAGSDYMDGGYGNDTYIYNIGDGNDKIYDGSGKDKIKFGEGISKDDLKFRKNKNTLFITIKGENTIEILNFFTKNGVIEEFVFSDESVMLSSDIAKLFSYSFSGKDTIYSQNGATLIGEKGDDVYIYQRGDGRAIIDDSFIESSITVDAGNDTLKLIGINRDDIVLTKYGNDMVIFIKDENGKTTSEQTICIKDFNDPLKGVETIEFDDKSTIEIDKNGRYPSVSFSSKSSYHFVYGSEDNDIKGANSSYTYDLGAGDDKIVASSYHDTIIGGIGNDVLEGGSGNDTYVFNRGDGRDIIFDTAGEDSIKFGDGISKDDIAVRVIGDTLYVGIKESGVKFSDYSDRITIRGWVSSSNRVEKFIFKNGETIDYNQIISMAGTDEDDTISTFQNSNDTINALGGNDTINSYDGDDLIDGGAGNDTIDGGLGNDKYIFKRGMGRDTITDGGGIDTIKVVDDVNISEVVYKRVGDDLVVYIDEDGIDESNYKDGAIVKGWFKSMSNRVEFIEFADGRVIRPEDITKFTNSNDNLTFGDEDNIIHALDGDDTIYAGGGNDKIYGGNGSDILYGGDGNDILDGGKGKDTLYGGKGNDTYLFGRGDGIDTINEGHDGSEWGDGNDTLEFKDGITPDDIVIYYENNQRRNLVVAIKEDGKSLNELSDKIILKEWYSYYYRVENFKFADGTIWNVSEIQKHINTDGNDIIYGIGNYRSSDTWNDILAGGKGDDTLYGYDGNDTYLFNKGDGKDTIIDSSGTDTLRLGEGIGKSDILLWLDGNNLVVSISDSDTITINNHASQSNAIEGIYLSNGLYMDKSTIDRVVSDIRLFASENALSLNRDTLLASPNILNIISSSWQKDMTDFTPPLVLDLNRNGTTSSSLAGSNVYFDYDGDGVREKTAWIESGDALLVYDKDRDGIISDGSELFGEYFRLSSGNYAKDGYEALKEFDSNGDGVINESDDNFEKLVLWFDDGDAKGEAGELKTLSEAGISSISLTPKDHETLENGNKISFESSFTKDNGTDGTLRDVWFEVSSKQSITISSLSDEDEKKISVVENFKGARLTDYQRANPMIISQILDEYESIKYDMMSQILAKKLYGDNAKSCTLLYNALNIKLSRIISGDATPKETILSINLLASVLKKDFTYAIFKLNPSYLSNEKIKALLDKTGISFSINQKDLNSIKGVIGKNVFGDDEAEIFDFSENKEGVNVLSKGGNDILMGSNFHDKLNGGNGNDILLGNDGIDTLMGSGGNDLLIGGKDSTIYEYYLGDGDDIIYDGGGKDILKLNFLKVADLSVGRANDDMVISIINPFKKDSIFGSITIKDGYKGGKIEEFFIGDKIYTFDEFLKAVPASSTYEFKKGSSLVEIDDKGGIDTLVFGEGITPNDIITLRNGSNLEIAIKIEGRTYNELLDRLIIKNFFTSQGEANGVGKIESFIFKSGIILNSSEILLGEITDDRFIIGDDKNNELVGTNNSNTINGKGGDDTLKGLLGDDAYIYEGGKDIIVDSGGVDKIVFGEGISRDDLQSKFIGNDLVIAIKEIGVKFEDLKDTITIKNQALANSKIEKIMYSDGSEFDIDTLKNREIKADKTISKTLLDIREINGAIRASDKDGDTLTFELIEESKFGTLTLNSDGGYTYKANDKFIGKDSAKVKISDGMGSEVITTINLSVKISAPVIDANELKFDEDTMYQGTISVNNPSGSALTYEIVGDASNSSVILKDDGNFTITPSLNYNGEDFITIKVTNEYGLSDIKTIALNILPINDAPEFKENISKFDLVNTSSITASLEASDIDSTALTYKVISNPTNGIISIDKNGNFTYIANKGYKGSDSAIVEVSDGELISTKEIKFDIKGYEYESGDLTISPDSLVDNTLKLPNLDIENAKFNKKGSDLILSTSSGDITIKDYFISSVKTVDTLIFKDGKSVSIDNTNLVVLDKESLQIRPSANLSGAGVIFSDLKNSILNGSNKDDTIISVGDNTKVYAKAGNDTIILNGDSSEVSGSSKNDTIISNGIGSFLKGENGDDTYIIGKDANNTIIRDKEYVNLVDGGNDTLILNDIDKASVEFKLGGTFNKDLVISYMNSSDDTLKTLTIENQKNKYSAIENISLNDTVLDKATIDRVIQDLNSYSSDNGISLDTFISTQNKDMIQIYQG